MSGAAEHSFDSLTVGERATLTHTLKAADLERFADLSGDANPLHMDAVYAKERGFAGRVAHGFFLGALVSQLVGMQLPGKHALLVKESLEFRKPAIEGDTVTVNAAVMAKSAATRLLELEIKIARSGETLAEGSVHVRVL